MADYDFDIGIIGGGAAGLTAASGASQLGARTLLIEKEKRLGGDCLHYGCVPSKTLIKSAKVYHLLKNSEKYGLPSIDVPPVRYRDIVNRIKNVIDVIQEHDSEKRFCSMGVRIMYGEPFFVDPFTIDLEGKKITSKKWVIATGSSQGIPPLEGIYDASYITNREIFYMDELPRSVAVLGAGPIAVEMAQALNRLGCSVSIIQRSGQILSKEDRDMADSVMEVLAQEGVRFCLDSSVSRLKKSGSNAEIFIKNKNGEECKITAEKVLIALGRVPNIKGLKLENAGVEYNEKGVPVDNRMRTSARHIYAAGDVTGKYQFTHAAGYEGSIVLSNAVVRLPRKADYTFLPWCTYTDPEFAGIGLNERNAAAEGIKYSVWTEEFKNNDRSLAEGEETGRIKMILDERERPVGVQIFGPGAGDLIGEWVAVLNSRMKLSGLASSMHPYPSFCEINKKVAGNFLAPKIFSEKVKKGLKLFFHLKGRACEPDEHG